MWKIMLSQLFLLGLTFCQQEPRVDGELTVTAQRKLTENRNSMAVLQANNMEGSLNHQFVFELSPRQRQEFYLHIPVAGPIVFMFALYVHSEDQATYLEVGDVEATPPVQITIFQNNNRVVAEDLFYFRGAFGFRGQEDSTYHIRFYTTKERRLIRVSHNSIFETLDFESMISSDAIQDYVKKAKELSGKMEFAIKGLKNTHSLVSQDQKAFAAVLSKYGHFQIAEVGLVLVICFTQIKIIGNLLKESLII